MCAAGAGVAFCPPPQRGNACGCHRKKTKQRRIAPTQNGCGVRWKKAKRTEPNTAAPRQRTGTADRSSRACSHGFRCWKETKACCNQMRNAETQLLYMRRDPADMSQYSRRSELESRVSHYRSQLNQVIAENRSPSGS